MKVLRYPWPTVAWSRTLSWSDCQSCGFDRSDWIWAHLHICTLGRWQGVGVPGTLAGVPGARHCLTRTHHCLTHRLSHFLIRRRTSFPPLTPRRCLSCRQASSWSLWFNCVLTRASLWDHWVKFSPSIFQIIALVFVLNLFHILVTKVRITFRKLTPQHTYLKHTCPKPKNSSQPHIAFYVWDTNYLEYKHVFDICAFVYLCICVFVWPVACAGSDLDKWREGATCFSTSSDNLVSIFSPSAKDLSMFKRPTSFNAA